MQEELAEGLHLIDFEQLKIENQSLNEKIEERNEDLAKLRKKTATTVQVPLLSSPGMFDLVVIGLLHRYHKRPFLHDFRALLF